MKYGLDIPNIGAFSDPRTLANLAQAAEESGWDGIFLWDTIHIWDNQPVADPWIALAAMAMQTERIKIGLQAAVPARRRPAKLAREITTFDHLSNGRLILGVVLGANEDKGFTHFGEELDLKKRAKIFDESLDILQGLWSGKPFSYTGEYHQVKEITFLPTPVQATIPIWVGWFWPNKKPLQRVARFAGASPQTTSGEVTPEDVQQIKASIQELRPTNAPFDIVVGGPVFAALTNEAARAQLLAYQKAGVTWSLQRIRIEDDAQTILHSIKQGPPKTS